MTSLTSFIFFAIAATGSPGPNNLLLMHSGLNFGIKRTWPYFLGSYIGCVLIYSLISFGLGYLLDYYPESKLVIKILGSIYMLYLSVKIAQMNENKTKGKIDKPLTTIQGVCLQLLNPKLWIVVLTMSSMFHVNADVFLNSIFFILLLSVITVLRMLIWMGLGRVIQRFIKSARQRKIFNLSLGLFLAITVLFLWI